jgi:hypothetical protein
VLLAAALRRFSIAILTTIGSEKLAHGGINYIGLFLHQGLDNMLNET